MGEKNKKPVFEAIKKNLDELYSKMETDNFDEWHDDLKAVINLFAGNEKEILDSLEFIKKELKTDQSKEKQNQLGKINGTINRLKFHDPEFLLQKLMSVGSAIAKEDEKLKKAIGENLIFRVLEQVRLGKRENAFHMIMRAFVVRHKKVPQALVETLSDRFDDEQFRAFMYAFLNNFIVEKK